MNLRMVGDVAHSQVARAQRAAFDDYLRRIMPDIGQYETPLEGARKVIELLASAIDPMDCAEPAATVSTNVVRDLQRREEGLRSDERDEHSKIGPIAIGGAEPHSYSPDAMAMGDCKKCGHPEDAPHHIKPRLPQLSRSARPVR